MTDRRYYILLFLLVIYPYQSTFNLLVGYSIKPLTYGLPFLLFLGVIFQRFNSLSSGKRFDLPIEKYSLLNLTISLVFLPLSLAISFLGGSMGFLVQYVGVFSFFIFKDVRISKRQKNILILATLVPVFVSVVYGIYEYLFARFALVNWVLDHSSHWTVTSGPELENGYRVLSLLGDAFYRSQSFELTFLTFGYQGFFLSTILLGILLLWDTLRAKIRMAFAVLLSFLGMVSSVTLSAIGMFAAGYFYFLFHLQGFKRIKMLSISVAVSSLVLVALLTWIPDLRGTVELAMQANSAQDRLAVHEIEDNYGKAMTHFFVGQGTASASTMMLWFPAGFYIEQQYYSTIAERGIIGLAVYVLFMYSIYSHLRTMKNRLIHGTLDYALAISLIWVWVFYVLVGFVHNAWGTDIDFLFMGLVGLISNDHINSQSHEELSRP